MRSQVRYMTLILAAAALVLSGQFGGVGAQAETTGMKEAKDMKDLRLYSAFAGEYTQVPAIDRTPDEWKAVLTEEQFYILRKEGTERPFTGKLLKENRQGVFKCAACGTDLFSSATKYKSGTGWPSYYEPVAPENVREVEDNSFFVKRVEIECARCGGHLGHVFTDGPKPTGLRYCINSASLTFAEGVPIPVKTEGSM